MATSEFNLFFFGVAQNTNDSLKTNCGCFAAASTEVSASSFDSVKSAASYLDFLIIL